jgi:hypothetical protein
MWAPTKQHDLSLVLPFKLSKMSNKGNEIKKNNLWQDKSEWIPEGN